MSVEPITGVWCRFCRTPIDSTPCRVLVGCHAGTDGECVWERCPQTRDGEPMATGRHCPRDSGTFDD